MCTTFGVSASYAGDLYVLDAHTLGARDGCNALLWDADTIFYNFGETDATVTLLGVSNGTLQAGIASTVVLPAGRASSIHQKVGLNWQPTSGPSLWLYHLSVPAGVNVDASLFPSVTNPFCATPVFVTQQYGKTSLPVFKALTAPGVPQVLTGLTTGDIPSHINVGIYNASDTQASATIELHRACDGAMTGNATVAVPGNTIEQFGAFLTQPSPVDCSQEGNGRNGLHSLWYAIVTVDQPSLSFASILANNQPPSSAIQVTGSQSP